MKEKAGSITLTFYNQEFWDEINCQAKSKYPEGKSLKTHIVDLLRKDNSNHATAELKRLRIDREKSNEEKPALVLRVAETP